MRQISLIIPTLNEEENIHSLLSRIEKVSERIRTGFSLEVIIIDDASEDKTVFEILKFKKNSRLEIKIIKREERGLATAVLAGFSAAKGNLLSVIDADLSHPPEVLIDLSEKIDEAEIVVASRLIKGGGVEDWPRTRKMLSRMGIWLTGFLGIGIKDPMSGFFLLKRSVIEKINLNPLGYKILLEILVKGDYKTCLEVPYIFLNRGIGKSKIGLKVETDYLRHFIRLLKWKYFNKRRH